MKALKLFIVVLVLVTSISAQAQQPANPTQVQVQRTGDNPLYKITVNVVERTTKAINYRHHSGSTKIDFRGTALLPDARGEAKVESKQGYIEIDVDFDNLRGATRFGPEYEFDPGDTRDGARTDRQYFRCTVLIQANTA